MKQINTIIFDLGGVLIDWNPEYVFREVIPDDDRRNYFFQHICTHDWNIEQDAGRPLAVATEMLVREFPDWETEIRTYYDRWEDMLGGPIHDTVDILRSLRDQKKHRLLALTNWSGETFPVALGLYDFLPYRLSSHPYLNAGGMLNTCKSNAEGCLHLDEWRTGE